MRRASVSRLLAAGALVLAFAPALKADVAPSPEVQRRVERFRERVAAANSARAAKASASASPSDSASPAPSGSGITLLGDELRKKWLELSATRRDRRERHRAEALREVGQRLSDPAVKAELALHATRVAELSRAEFLAQNARSGAARDKLLAKVATLSARELERHQARLAKLLAVAATAPSAAATPSAPTSAAATPPSAPSSGAP